MRSGSEGLPIAALDAADALVIAILVAAFLLLTVLPLTVSFLKGRNWLGVLGLLVAIPFAWWGTIRPARPDSWWAKNRYTPDQIAKAEALYAPDDPQPAPGEGSWPAGWYADPWDDGERRYWDGTEWTGHVEESGEPTGEPPTS